MKKKYTKKQILESIKYWQKQLKLGNYKKLNEDVEEIQLLDIVKDGNEWLEGLPLDILENPDPKLKRLLGSLTITVKEDTPYDTTVELNGDPEDIAWFKAGSEGESSPQWDRLIAYLETIV